MSPEPLSWRPTEALRKFLLLAAVVIFVDQTAILLASIVPPTPSSPQWRFGAVGLAAGRATPLLVADLLLLLSLFASGSRVTLRVIAGIHVLVALAVLAILGLFALDTLEIRSLQPLEGRTQMMASAIRAAIALVVVAGYCLWSAAIIIRGTMRTSVRSADQRIVMETHSAGG